MEEINEEKLEYINKASMEIILHAGDARNLIFEAIDLLADKEYEKVEDKLKKAYEEIKIAHRTQTKIVQEELTDMTIPHTFLFAHAQDTIMTVYTEYNLISKLITVFKKH